jgi:rod shape-determining protein MreC
MVSPRENKNNPVRSSILGLKFLGLIILSILLMYLDNRNDHLGLVRKGISAAIYPARIMVDSPFQLWEWLEESISSRSDLKQKLSKFESEKLLTDGRLQKLSSLEAENKRLRTLLNVRLKISDKTLIAEIMSAKANPYDHSIVINLGTKDGVFDGHALIGSDGVIGQVIKADLMSSIAMLISDTDHALPVEVNRNGLRTIVVGTGAIDTLELPFVVNNADINIGDLLVTSGFSGTFPAGYPVAIVNSVTRMPHQSYAKVTATPAASLGKTREVLLVSSESIQNYKLIENE